MNIIERAKAPTSKFFRTLRNVGLALAAAGAALLASPVALPAAIVTIGGYLTVGGAILSAVSQITVEGDTSSETSQSNGKSS
jgi:hypothetical protein